MIIPIQHEGSGVTYNKNNNYSPSSTSQTKSSYTSNKKSVRITPKITDVEVMYPFKQTLSSPIKSALKNPSSNKLHNWDNFSALKVFEEDNKRWGRDDIENFLLPSSSPSNFSSNLLKEKFDNFTSQMMMKPRMFSENPIKIETFVTESDKYVLTLNVAQFKPEELEVKVTDQEISVTGKHEDKRDEHNFRCEEYSRKHSLPPGVKADDVKCRITGNGVLTISAPRKDQPALEYRERTIPIQQHSAIRV